MTNTSTRPASTRSSTAWRTVDIVVTAVIGIAFGVVFWAWNNLWSATGPAFAGFPPLQGVIYGVWLMPAVLAPLIVRKPGAGVFAELLAAIVSTFFGSPWGLMTVLYGLFQGLAGEIAFGALGYRVWRLPVAIAAGALAGLAAALLDIVNYYGTWSGGWQLTYTVTLAVSSAVIAGLGSWLLVRGLAETGVLAPFASGRGQREV
jgi:energy-coupling factor transport system substrate-specific component